MDLKTGTRSVWQIVAAYCRNMVSLKVKNCEIYFSFPAAVLELAAVFFLVKTVPFFRGLGMGYLDFAGVSLLVLAGAFFSLFLHEFAHFWAARWMRLPARKITISPFGAYTSFEREPSTPKEAFVISIAGPLMSILAGSIFYLIHLAVQPYSVVAGTAFLCVAVFNGIFSSYNLLPVMPLDGALVLRSIFWKASRDHGWSTNVSFAIGTGVVLISIAAGVVHFIIFKPFVSAAFFFLGASLWQTERLAYRQLRVARFFSCINPAAASKK